jgi:hypothetical protein
MAEVLNYTVERVGERHEEIVRCLAPGSVLKFV